MLIISDREKTMQAVRTTLAMLLISSLFLLTACSDQAVEPETTSEEDSPHLLQAQEDAMDRARAVEDQLQEAADQRLDDADAQGGG